MNIGNISIGQNLPHDISALIEEAIERAWA
jgi:hypothetical protein